MFNGILNVAVSCVCLNKVMYLILCKFSIVAIVHFKHEIFTGLSKLFLVTKQLFSSQTGVKLI